MSTIKANFPTAIGAGEAYRAEYGNQVDITYSAWPDLAAIGVTTVRLDAEHKHVPGARFSLTGSVTAARAIRFEISPSDTADVLAGTYAFDVQAIVPDSTDEIALMGGGLLFVLPDVGAD